jgi:hypothetical protein
MASILEASNPNFVENHAKNRLVHALGIEKYVQINHIPKRKFNTKTNPYNNINNAKIPQGYITRGYQG